MTMPDVIRIVQISVFTGPSCWSAMPVVEALIDATPAGLDGANRLFSLMAPAGAVPDQGSGESIWRDMGSVIAGVAVQMQEDADQPVRFSVSQPAHLPGSYFVAIDYRHADLTIACIRTTVRLLNALLFGAEPGLDFAAVFASDVLSLDEKRRWRPQEDALTAEAKRRGIPMRRIASGSNLIEFGTGAHLRRYRDMNTGFTSRIGSMISGSKVMTNQLLLETGLPVPVGRLVRSRQEALAAAEEIGYPVVVKPADSGKGRGVSIDLRNAPEVSNAFRHASLVAHRNRVIVERFVPGFEYRLLVIGGKFVAASRRDPAEVAGDGSHTIQELIDITNTDPLRGLGNMRILNRIPLDAMTTETLARAGLALETVPAAGEIVPVKVVSNLSQGGTAHDLTESVHPEYARLAVLAASVAGLDICGIDMVTTDITRSIWETGGAIIEINSQPGPTIHSHPQSGQPRSIAVVVLDLLYPADAPVRIPVVAVLGGTTAPSVAERIARYLESKGALVGSSTIERHIVCGHEMARPDLRGAAHPQLVLRNPDVEIAVLQIAPDNLAPPGLPFDRCDVVVLLDAVGERPGTRSVEDVLIEAASPDGGIIISATHTAFGQLRSRLPANSVVFATDPHNSTLGDWTAAGRIGLTLREGGLIHTESGEERVLSAAGDGSKEEQLVVAALSLLSDQCISWF